MTDETETAAPRGAVLQFEIDRKRVGNYPDDAEFSDRHRGIRYRYWSLLKSALADTLNHGGTFVVVVSEEKITAVQRPDAEEL